ncbi:MAG: hypothetical protein QXV81_09015 [Ignisphaera sp.]
MGRTEGAIARSPGNVELEIKLKVPEDGKPIDLVVTVHVEPLTQNEFSPSYKDIVGGFKGSDVITGS